MDAFTTASPGIQLPRIAAVGEKTAQMLEHYRLSADIVPSEYVAEELLNELRQTIQKGERVLIPRGNLGRQLLVEELEKHGAEVTELVVYVTERPAGAGVALDRAFSEETIDVITLTSSSTVRNFHELIREYRGEGTITKVPIACIGPIAAKAAETLGLTVQIMPERYTIEALVTAICDYFKEEERN